MKKAFHRVSVLFAASAIVALISSCEKVEEVNPDTNTPIDSGDINIPEEQYWEDVDVAFAVDGFDGHGANHTEFKDFDGDGYVDIIGKDFLDGMIFYKNSGSENFFSETNSEIILDPEDVDLSAIGHWGDLDGIGSFALADYNKDGHLDAIFEGTISGVVNTLEPAIVYAEGNGEKLIAKTSINPWYNKDDYSKVGFSILGSYYFPDRKSEQIIYYLPDDLAAIPEQEDHPAYGKSIMGAFPYDPDCEYGLSHSDSPCTFTYRYDQMKLVEHWKGLVVEIDEAQSDTYNYLLSDGEVYTDDIEQRVFWGISPPDQNEFDRPKAINVQRLVQSSIGELEQDNYTIVHISQLDELERLGTNYVLLVKNFENEVPNGQGLPDGNAEEIAVDRGVLMGGTTMDFNEDGLDDIIVSLQNEGQLEVVVMENKGDFQFEFADIIFQTELMEDLDFVRLKKYDFNQDGKTDLYLQGLGKILIHS